MKTSLRIIRLLGKVILGILLVLISAVAIVHLPPVQKQITRAVANYLSTKVNAKVDIQQIEFTILGHIIIEGLTLWNPEEVKILSIGKLEVNSSLFDLLSGDLIFEEIRMVGFNGQLTEKENRLNIQFILDAFQSTEPQTTSSPSAVHLQCKTIHLENIHFEYISTTGGISVANEVGELILQDAELSTDAILFIRAKSVSLQRSEINIITTTSEETANTYTSKSDSIYSRSSIQIEVKQFQVGQSNFSFHQDTVSHTPKFDPSHIDLKKIQINLSDILIGIQKDTVAATLHSLSAQLPGFKVDEAQANHLHWSHDQLIASGFHFMSGSDQLNVDFHGMHNMQSDHNLNNFSVDLDAYGKIVPNHFAYFLSDSILNHFGHWTSTDVKLKGRYNLKEGEIKTLDLQTENSRLHADGQIGDVPDLNKIHWNNLSVKASIGLDFKQTLNPFLPTINLPNNTSLNIKSSGNTKDADVDGKVISDWGNVNFNGKAGLQADNFNINLKLDGEHVDLGKWLDVSWGGPMDFNLSTDGWIGNDTNLEVNGSIDTFEMANQLIHQIDLQSKIGRSDARVNLQVNDAQYKSEIQSDISFAGPVILTSNIALHGFKPGEVLHLDSTLSVSGKLKSKIALESSALEISVTADTLVFQNQSTQYSLDTLSFHSLLSPTANTINYFSDYEKANLKADFDIADSPEIFYNLLLNLIRGNPTKVSSDKNRNLEFNIELQNSKLFQLLNIDVNESSSLHVQGEWNEQKQSSVLQATAGNLKAYGTSLDSLDAKFIVLHDSVEASMNAKNLVYNSIGIGNLNFDVLFKGDTAASNLRLANDTLTILNLHTKILPTDSGAFFFLDKVLALDKNYSVDRNNPIYIDNKNVVLHTFQISRDDMKINLDGDLNTFNASLQNVNLTPLNFLISTDTVVIQKGLLNGVISYSPKEKYLNLEAKIDSLSIYNSDMLTIDATAESNGNSNVPFEFLLTNTSNKIDVKGDYNIDNTELDATLHMNINNPELFSFLISDVVDEVSGTLKGETKITGPIQKPIFKGDLQFQNVALTTANPKFIFNVKDDHVTLDSSSMVFNHFTVFDQEEHPLDVDGIITTEDYQSFTYDLQLKAQDYTLMNKADSTGGQLKGVLVIDSDIKLKGNEKDTNVEAKLTIKDKTHLIFVSSTNDVELLKAEGIVEFVDPSVALDTALHQSANFYDSLIASLPDFNLSSTVKIEENAKLTIVVDAQSGDYMETSGGASLELDYDRLGNIHLVGDYTIKKGVYRLSFYDLVKRNFTLVANSSIHWSGNPENGDLNIKAIHTVESNSIGLIGHEIGENEKAIYKRSLDYEVGIIIGGTLDKPIVSFSLDLPEREKANYPVLANKLDRLKQPEYQSELNKQVFGLLVLGGFIPETTGSDINSSQIATTALSNSVNSLLASQLNKFASQYIKGVNIDVGIQSYSDYSSPGGKTQTAMDFRVSKRILDDRLSFEVGGDFDINQDQSGANSGTKNYRGDVAIIYDLTGNGDKQLKLFNNETYDIVYQEIRNTGISLIFIREFSEEERKKRKKK